MTIITICKNNLDELIRTLRALDNKNLNIQHIIIDGSNNSKIKNYLINNLYLCEYYKQLDSGIYTAINLGLIYAKGNYINILNSGDYHDHQVLEKINFQKNYEIIAISTRMIKKNIVVKTWEPLKEYKKLNLVDMPMAHQSIFIHRNIYRKYGYYNIQYKYSSDYDFVKKIFTSDTLSFKQYQNLYTNFILGGASSNKEAIFETLKINLSYSEHICDKFSAYFNFLMRIIKNYINK